MGEEVHTHCTADVRAVKLDDTNSTLMSLSSVDSMWIRLCTPGVCVGGGGGERRDRRGVQVVRTDRVKKGE